LVTGGDGRAAELLNGGEISLPSLSGELNPRSCEMTGAGGGVPAAATAFAILVFFDFFSLVATFFFFLAGPFSLLTLVLTGGEVALRFRSLVETGFSGSGDGFGDGLL